MTIYIIQFEFIIFNFQLKVQTYTLHIENVIEQTNEQKSPLEKFVTEVSGIFISIL